MSKEIKIRLIPWDTYCVSEKMYFDNYPFWRASAFVDSNFVINNNLLPLIYNFIGVLNSMDSVIMSGKDGFLSPYSGEIALDFLYTVSRCILSSKLNKVPEASTEIMA